MKHKINKFLTALLFFAGVYCPLAVASNQIPAPPQSEPIALTGAAIHSMDRPVVENGTIIFDKGRIVGLGRDVPIPAGAQVVDLSGKRIYPGLIESASRLGLTEISAVRATLDFAEIGLINPNVRAQVAINPDSEHIPVARANGVALAVSAPFGGLISGQASLLQLDGWTWEDMTLKSSVAMMVNWPRIRSGKAGDSDRKMIQTLQKAFRDARAYLTAVEAAEQKGAQSPKPDLRWQAMIPVLKGDLPVWVRADNLRQIRASVDWADREKIKLVLVGGADSHRAADLLIRKGVPVIVTPVQRLPARRDSGYDDPFTLAARLHQAGIKFCIAGGPGSGTERNLPYHAAMAAAYGLPKEEAIKAITRYPAEIIGLDNRIGTLAEGKDATLIVTDGDPLEITTRVERLYIQGRPVDLNNRHKTLYSKYVQKYEQEGR
ncbi:amidohydrolase family protein [candidate division KSB1 bacterium]